MYLLYLFNVSCCISFIFEMGLQKWECCISGWIHRSSGETLPHAIHRGCIISCNGQQCVRAAVPLHSLTNRACRRMFESCQYEREVGSRCRFNLYFFYCEWGRACFLMFYQLFLFSRKLLIFFSPFFCRFAGHLSFYFRNIHPLPMYVTNIFGQVVLLHSLFCILGVQGLYKFFSVLSNHVYKSFPLNSETLRSLPTHNTWRNSPIFFLVFVFIFTFSFLVHLEFILMNNDKKIIVSFSIWLFRYANTTY